MIHVFKFRTPEQRGEQPKIKQQRIMKIYLILACFCFLSLDFVQAIEKKVIDRVNKYGGPTVTTVYHRNDKEYKLKEKTEYFDNSGIMRRMEGYRLLNQYNDLKIEKVIEDYASNGILYRSEININEEKANQLGYHKVITFYNMDGIKSRKEVYYNHSEFDKMVYWKSIDIFSVVGKKIRSEYYLTPEDAEKTGYYKLVSYYEKGEVIKQEMLAKEGIVY